MWHGGCNEEIYDATWKRNASLRRQPNQPNPMKTITQTLALAGAVFALAAGAYQANAQADAPQPPPGGGDNNQPGNRTSRQGRGNFDPEEFRKRMNERMKEQFGVTNDDEWKIISERIEKVMEARRGTGGGFGMFIGGGPGGPGGRGPGGPGGPGGGGDRGGDRGPGGDRGGGSPESDALRKAIESKASKEEMKAALAKFREARKANEEKLEKAQAELLEVLTVQQEAVAVMMGLVK
jgi:hypothetical protein